MAMFCENDPIVCPSTPDCTNHVLTPDTSDSTGCTKWTSFPGCVLVSVFTTHVITGLLLFCWLSVCPSGIKLFGQSGFGLSAGWAKRDYCLFGQVWPLRKASTVVQWVRAGMLPPSEVATNVGGWGFIGVVKLHLWCAPTFGLVQWLSRGFLR